MNISNIWSLPNSLAIFLARAREEEQNFSLFLCSIASILSVKEASESLANRHLMHTEPFLRKEMAL